MTIIARTTISIQLPNGTKDMEIRISAPEPIENDCWRCWYEIDWPDQPRRYYAEGANSMQALVWGLLSLGTELNVSRAHKEGRLNAEQPGYGIPVPSVIRRYLVGDDAQYL